jgi:hypothetical protein
LVDGRIDGAGGGDPEGPGSVAAELSDLDRRFDETFDWIVTAAHSLHSSFWTDHGRPSRDLAGEETEDEAEHWAGFLRDTFSGADLGATSTYRSFGALLEFVRFAAEEDKLVLGKQFDLPASATATGKLAIARLVERLTLTAEQFVLRDDARKVSHNHGNVFSSAHALLAFAGMGTLRAFARAGALDRPLDRLGAASLGEHTSVDEKLADLSAAVVDELCAAFVAGRRTGEPGGRLLPITGDGASEDAPPPERRRDPRSTPVHDVITLSVVRGVDAVAEVVLVEVGLNEPVRAFADELRDSNMADAVLARLQAQLGFDAACVESRFDAGDLVFGVALLDRLEIEGAAEIRRHAIDVLARRQGPDGGWPTSRILSHGHARLLHIASYEYALTLAFVGLARLEVGDVDTVRRILPILDRCFTLVRSNHVLVPRPDGWPDADPDAQATVHGWCNDHTQFDGLIESWATAVVLLFLLRYRRLLGRFRQHLVLAQYRVKADRPRSWLRAWPDLRWELRGPRPFRPTDLALPGSATRPPTARSSNG